MSGGGGSSFGTSQIRVAITNLAQYSSKPKVPKNGDDDCIKCDDPSRPDCRDEPLQRALAAVETAAAAEGADLVLLPETFACAGMDMHEMKGYADKQDSLGHPHLKQLKQVAQRLGVNIVAGFFLKEGKRYRNTAIVINRAGVLLGRYYKCYLSAEEMAHGVAPGSDVVVVDTDVGRVGLSICFDINWPHHFASVFAKGADFCVWLSRHDGGLPLQAAAMNTRMPILTSTLDSTAKVIDCMGRVQAQSSRWKRYATYDLCMRESQGMFHIDGNLQKMESIQRAYVGRVRIRTAEEEGLWTIDCLDAQLSISVRPPTSERPPSVCFSVRVAVSICMGVYVCKNIKVTFVDTNP
mmetsp:Transcript_41847/g.75158  ORF Transcript_41847/g.75158 Transcript_41847/m.75158 type:complete len:352 (-) Transcript_41847:141-1196(-)